MLLLDRVRFRGNGYDSLRGQPERVQEVAHSAGTALETRQLVYLGRRFADGCRRTVAKIGFEVVSVQLQLALRDSEVQLHERLDPARLEFAEIYPQGIGGDAREPTNVLVGHMRLVA